jgi:hypothetical protein
VPTLIFQDVLMITTTLMGGVDKGYQMITTTDHSYDADEPACLCSFNPWMFVG